MLRRLWTRVLKHSFEEGKRDYLDALLQHSSQAKRQFLERIINSEHVKLLEKAVKSGKIEMIGWMKSHVPDIFAERLNDPDIVPSFVYAALAEGIGSFVFVIFFVWF